MQELDVKRVRYIIESPRSAVPQFHEYLEARYRLIRTFADRDEVSERKADDTALEASTSAPQT